MRNDKVWIEPNPVRDRVDDRCSMSFKYLLHSVKERPGRLTALIALERGAFRPLRAPVSVARAPSEYRQIQAGTARAPAVERPCRAVLLPLWEGQELRGEP